MRVLIVNTNGGSIYHGPNLRTYYAAKELVARGHQVVLATSAFSHKYAVLPETRGPVTPETIDGIEYRWVRAFRYRNLVGRVFHNAAFGVRLLIHRRQVCDTADVVVFSGPPLELFPFTWLIARRLGAPIASDIRDLWPLTQLDMSAWHWLSPYTYLQYACLWLMGRMSEVCVSPLSGAGRYLDKICGRVRTVVIPNGFDTSIRPPEEPPMLTVVKPSLGMPPAGSQVSIQAIRGKARFVVGYSGSFDRDNDTESFVRAAELLSEREDILFLMVGAGLRRERIALMGASLPNLLVCDRVPSRAVPRVLESMDACYCGLRRKPINMYGVGLAKSYEYMAAGKPILWMIETDNNPVEDSGGGVTVPPEDHRALAAAIERLAAMPEAELVAIGERARKHLDAHFALNVLGGLWERCLATAAGR
jgi:glycosyltransferase involved in cell wall biosynthesis